MSNDQGTTYFFPKLMEMLRILSTGLNQCIKLIDQENYIEAKSKITNIEKVISDFVFKLTLDLSKFKDEK